MPKRAAGVHIIELCVGVIVLIPLVLFAVDVATLFFGQTTLSAVCRDACRSAASGPPDGLAAATVNATARAKRVFRDRTDSRSIIRLDPESVTVSQNIVNRPEPTWGGPVTGTVRVHGECSVYPPFLMKSVNPIVRLRSESTFPITYVMPPSYRLGLHNNPRGGNSPPPVPGTGTGEPPPPPAGETLPPPGGGGGMPPDTNNK